MLLDMVVSMFIRKSISRQDGRVYTNYVLVESIRTDKGPRQRTICSLGDLRPRSGAEWLKLARRIEEKLSGQLTFWEEEDQEVDKLARLVKERRRTGKRKKQKTELKTELLLSVKTDAVTTEQHREAGPVHVGYEFWKRLGFDEILKHAGMNKKSRLLTCTMVLNRLIAPHSEHAMPAWIRETALGDILGVDFTELSYAALYRNLDRLHPHRVEIEAKLVEKERDLFAREQTILLYDITSTYFEGQAKRTPKAKRGYSRDKRPDCKQVLIGLVVDRDGFPVAHEVFAGNRQDKTTLAEMLDALGKRLKLHPGQTVVIDRGFATEENLALLQQRQLHYLIAARHAERDQWLCELENLDGFEEVKRIPSPRNPFQKKTRVRVKQLTKDGETIVLCISDGRVEKDRAIRERKEQLFLKDVEKLQARITNGRLVDEKKIWEAIGRLKERYPSIARYYTLSLEPTERTLLSKKNEARYQLAQKLDGSYLLKTDRTDLSALDLWPIYISLTRAEDAFRKMKSPLAERPIFHHVEHRVETHIFLCLLAYHLLIAIEKTFLDKGIHTSWWTLRERLRTHYICTIVLPTSDGKILRIRRSATPDPGHREIYNTLGIAHQIIKPIQKWISRPLLEHNTKDIVCSDEYAP